MIMGIDLGKSIGWVMGDRVGPLYRGTIEIEGAPNFGLFLENTCAAFHEILSKGRITGIAVEMPFMGQSYYVARSLMGQLAMLHMIARSYGVSTAMIEEIAISSGKAALSGKGNADADQMIAAAADHGYEGLDEHQAHALGVFWVYQFGKKPAPAKRPRTGKGVVVKP